MRYSKGKNSFLARISEHLFVRYIEDKQFPE